MANVVELFTDKDIWILKLLFLPLVDYDQASWSAKLTPSTAAETESTHSTLRCTSSYHPLGRTMLVYLATCHLSSLLSVSPRAAFSALQLYRCRHSGWVNVSCVKQLRFDVHIHLHGKLIWAQSRVRGCHLLVQGSLFVEFRTEPRESIVALRI